MKSQDIKHSDQDRGVLDQLESVKDALHAVDDDIAGLLTRPAEEPASATIPVLNDVVARTGDSNSSVEASADHQLSRTNSYQVVTDAHLAGERSTDSPHPDPDPDPDPELEPAPSTPQASQIESNPAESTAGPVAEEVSSTTPSPQTSDKGMPPQNQTEENIQEKSIVPDFDQLEAELGVEPLPGPLGTEAAGDVEILFDTGELDGAAANGPHEEGIDIDAELASFSLQGSTSISMTAGELFSNIPIEVSAKPSPVSPTLTRQQLTALIEEVLDSHMVALQEALLEKLAPFAEDSPGEQG